MIEDRNDLGPVVTIQQSEYKSLLNIKTRVDVAVERMSNDEFCKIETILRILNTELALQRADEIQEEEKRRNMKFLKQNKEGCGKY